METHKLHQEGQKEETANLERPTECIFEDKAKLPRWDQCGIEQKDETSSEDHESSKENTRATLIGSKVAAKIQSKMSNIAPR